MSKFLENMKILPFDNFIIFCDLPRFHLRSVLFLQSLRFLLGDAYLVQNANNLSENDM